MQLIPNSWGVREHGDPSRPGPYPHGMKGWRPTMGRTEAYNWATAQGADPHYGTVVVSSPEKAAAIMQGGFSLGTNTTGRVWGDGVYIGLGWDSEDYYARMKRSRVEGGEGGGGPVALDVVAALRRPLVLSFGDKALTDQTITSVEDLVLRMAPEIDLQVRAASSSSTGYRTWRQRQAERTHEYTEALKRLGYDGIKIVGREGVPALGRFGVRGGPWAVIGGQQIVVFDPKQVTVIRQRPPKYAD